jgi:hypothetical protein
MKVILNMDLTYRFIRDKISLANKSPSSSEQMSRYTTAQEESKSEGACTACTKVESGCKADIILFIGRNEARRGKSPAGCWELPVPAVLNAREPDKSTRSIIVLSPVD